MIHQYDHRWTTRGDRDVTSDAQASLPTEPAGRYWAPSTCVRELLKTRRWDRDWQVGWRDITNATNERTVIAAAFPFGGSDFTIRVVTSPSIEAVVLLLATCNSLVFDYCARCKLGGLIFQTT